MTRSDANDLIDAIDRLIRARINNQNEAALESKADIADELSKLPTTLDISRFMLNLWTARATRSMVTDAITAESKSERTPINEPHPDKV